MAEEPSSAPESLAGEISAKSGFSANVHGRSSLASWLISAAAAAARDARDAARNPESRPAQLADNLGGRGEIQKAATAIVMATAALEACCNEYIQNLTESSRGLTEAATEDLRSVLGSKDRTFDKIRHLLKTLEAGHVGREPYQGVKLVLQLRNAIVHSRTTRSDVELPEFQQKLARLLDKAGLRRHAPDGTGYMPLPYLHWRSARWAVRTVLDASKDLSRITNQADCLSEPAFDLSLPSDQD